MATETTPAADLADFARIDSIRAKLAELTGGEVYGFSSVKVSGSVREVFIMVDDSVTISVDSGIETLPAGLTFRQISDHALAAANGSPECIGEVITRDHYAAVMGA